MSDLQSAGGRAAGNMGTDTSGASIGQLFAEISADMSHLIRQEIELAKAEIKVEVNKVAKGGGMLGGAGLAGYMVLVIGSMALAFAIGSKTGIGWGFFIVTVLWAAIGAVLFVLGRAQLRTVNPKPELTVETLKEDAQWARHPKS